jgi:hypothetical protein
MAGGDGSLATAFYRENQAAMDAGADLAWPERFPPSFVSAIEFAMVLRHRSPSVFAAEYQNEPIDDTLNTDLLSADQIAAKQNGYARGLVPNDAAHLTAFIDVQGKLLYWAVVAWRPTSLATWSITAHGPNRSGSTTRWPTPCRRFPMLWRWDLRPRRLRRWKADRDSLRQGMAG